MGNFVSGPPPKELRTVNKAIVSNVQNEGYVPYVLCLAHTILKYNPDITDIADLIVLVPNENDITPVSMARLQAVGWSIRMEDDLLFEGIEDLNWNFRRNFIKLRIWLWTEYRKIAFLDADVVVRGDISLLVHDGFGTSLSTLLTS
jgi:alpha-N-acetylglucosamine transferase